MDLAKVFFLLTSSFISCYITTITYITNGG